jgi:hypothetical protein
MPAGVHVARRSMSTPDSIKVNSEHCREWGRTLASRWRVGELQLMWVKLDLVVGCACPLASFAPDAPFPARFAPPFCQRRGRLLSHRKQLCDHVVGEQNAHHRPRTGRRKQLDSFPFCCLRCLESCACHGLGSVLHSRRVGALFREGRCFHGVFCGKIPSLLAKGLTY